MIGGQRRTANPPARGALRRCLQLTALDEVVLRPGRMTPSDVVARARAQADAGVQHLIVNMPDAWDVRHLELLGREVIPIAA
jgi:hypothetical protein